jgi:hypothetical protein
LIVVSCAEAVAADIITARAKTKVLAEILI